MVSNQADWLQLVSVASAQLSTDVFMFGKEKIKKTFLLDFR